MNIEERLAIAEDAALKATNRLSLLAGRLEALTLIVSTLLSKGDGATRRAVLDCVDDTVRNMRSGDADVMRLEGILGVLNHFRIEAERRASP